MYLKSLLEREMYNIMVKKSRKAYMFKTKNVQMFSKHKIIQLDVYGKLWNTNLSVL